MQKHKNDMFWVCLFERYLSSAIRSFARLDRQRLKKEKKAKTMTNPSHSILRLKTLQEVWHSLSFSFLSHRKNINEHLKRKKSQVRNRWFSPKWHFQHWAPQLAIVAIVKRVLTQQLLWSSSASAETLSCHRLNLKKKNFLYSYHCYNYSVSYNTYICTWLWWPLSSSYYNHCQKLWKSTTSVLSHTGVSVVVVIIISVLIIIIVVVVINRSTVAILERVLTQLNNAFHRCSSHHWELI